MPSGLASLLWFCAVVALIPASLWLLKRTPLGGGASSEGLKSISSLALSTSQRLVTVEVGTGDERRWLVLGVTPSSITTLHAMAPQALPERASLPPVHPAFAQILGRFRKDGTGATRAG